MSPTLPADRQRKPNRGLHQIWRGARRHRGRATIASGRRFLAARGKQLPRDYRGRNVNQFARDSPLEGAGFSRSLAGLGPLRAGTTARGKRIWHTSTRLHPLSGHPRVATGWRVGDYNDALATSSAKGLKTTLAAARWWPVWRVGTSVGRCRSNAERLMTFNTSLVAVWYSSDSWRSFVRCRNSTSSRAFSIAITAWAAKFCNARFALRKRGSTPRTLHAANKKA
jgi:hypothetical protein